MTTADGIIGHHFPTASYCPQPLLLGLYALTTYQVEGTRPLVRSMLKFGSSIPPSFAKDIEALLLLLINVVAAVWVKAEASHGSKMRDLFQTRLSLRRTKGFVVVVYPGSVSCKDDSLSTLFCSRNAPLTCRLFLFALPFGAARSISVRLSPG